MSKLPILKGGELIKILESMGFKKVRQRGSHVRLKHDDGRVTTVPIHKGRDIPKGLLRKIIREDLELTTEEFLKFLKRK
ncbi:type II toxin-antitoxin system HicA family toxin [Desulfurobacterium thermolithotrophum]|uniref:type II toxin-antitoxin system HicA family toxin n=1 Tax=Desulfurobacterium thermolithotrophum TaxID=64160 RepID=UPI0013D0DA64|nr:type II toxin-antitoxin system HicA family toxin [Desulfurobacterium thermolithotrophum]